MIKPPSQSWKQISRSLGEIIDFRINNENHQTGGNCPVVPAYDFQQEKWSQGLQAETELQRNMARMYANTIPPRKNLPTNRNRSIPTDALTLVSDLTLFIVLIVHVETKQVKHFQRANQQT